jgi:carbon storage regulator CsrA
MAIKAKRRADGNLVLARKVNESVTLRNENDGSEIVVTVSKINGNKTSIGFNAPLHVKIARTELMTKGATEPC